jgi:hypothetical protein
MSCSDILVEPQAVNCCMIRLRFAASKQESEEEEAMAGN